MIADVDWPKNQGQSACLSPYKKPCHPHSPGPATSPSSDMSLPHEEVNKLWFGGLEFEPGKPFPDEAISRWFQQSDDFDNKCRSLLPPVIYSFCRPYHSLIHKIVELPAASLFALASSAEDSLTLMILLDQIARNIMRGPDSPFVYTKCDPTAQHVAHHCLRLGHDKEHPPHKRIWYYLALFHSESVLDQELALSKFAGLIVEVRLGEWKASVPIYKEALNRSIKPFTTIEKFGRFPERNVILKRVSTEEEEKFLVGSG